MLKRKRNALMADVNRGLKNNAYVLGSGIGAVTRFAYQAYLKRVACNIPVSIELPPPYRYYEGTDATNFVANWNNPTIFTMTQFGGLGPATAHGYSTGPINFTLTLPNLGTHSRIRYRVKWHLVDSLDNETSRMYIGNGSDETEVLTFTKLFSGAPIASFTAEQLTTSWSGPQPYSYTPWTISSGNETINGYLDIDSGWIAHTSSTLTVRHFMGANQAPNDEAMYLTHVEVLMDSLPLPPSRFYSKNNVTDGGFTTGYIVTKDMANGEYTDEFDPNDYYPEFFPNMAPFTNENIVVGDKNEDDRLIASYWDDLGNDVFDDWGFFYLYDVPSGKYYFPLISPQNEDDGIFFTQTFNAFGRTFTITHGWAVQGIFKFDISVADNFPFKFGAYGNMGSDGDEITEELTHNYSINGENFTLYYHHHQEDGDNREQLYSYWIPKKVSENSINTYSVYYNGDDMSIFSKDVTTGLTVYFAKSYDVKNWVINDIGASS